MSDKLEQAARDFLKNNVSASSVGLKVSERELALLVTFAEDQVRAERKRIAERIQVWHVPEKCVEGDCWLCSLATALQRNWKGSEAMSYELEQARNWIKINGKMTWMHDKVEALAALLFAAEKQVFEKACKKACCLCADSECHPATFDQGEWTHAGYKCSASQIRSAFPQFGEKK